MKILCVYPSLISGWASYNEHGNNESSYMDHGLAMLSAVLKKAGHTVWLMDLRSFQNWGNFEDVLRQQDYDFSIVSFFSANERFARQSVEIMKQVHPNKLIVGGGVHLSVTQATQYPNIDTIVWGEGENHILEIARDIEAGRKPKSVYELSPIPDLDSLPYVDRQLFNPRQEETSPLLAGLPEPFITIVAGRGCWGKCTFCAPTRNLISGNKIRIRSVDHFLGEIIELNKRPGGIGSLMIHDDLLGTKDWMAEFIDKWNKNLPRIPWWCQLRADTIIRMRDFIPALADIGMTYVSVGLESGSQRMLDFLQKGTTVMQNIEACQLLHDNNINIFGNYIVGLPTETKEDLDGTEQMLSAIKPAFHSASTYTSYPGATLYNWIKENNYWSEPEEHYSQTRYPFERKIKGVDYGAVWARGVSWRSRFTSPVRYYTKRETPKIVYTGLKLDESGVSPQNEDNKPTLNPVRPVASQNDGLTPKPRVSVIMVCYNRPELMKEAIDSVLKQTIQDWELLIMDYSEPERDNTKAVCREYMAMDKRIRAVFHEVNINNIAICWNEALDLIRGDYWCLLDDDNRKHPDYLEKMIAPLEADFAKVGSICFMTHFGTTTGHHQFDLNFDMVRLRAGNFIDSGMLLLRKSVIDKIGYFDERLATLDDWEFVIRLFTYYKKTEICFIPESLCDYRWHSTKRMYKSRELGIQEHGIILAAKQYPERLKLFLIPHKERGITQSQKDVYSGVKEALGLIPFVDLAEHANPDLIIIIGPIWNYTKDEILGYKEKLQAPVMGLLTEDTQGIQGNLFLIHELDWVVSNDISAVTHYKSIHGKPKQIYHWNCLSLNQAVVEECAKPHDKKYDVCFIGYPYPSRVGFIKWLRMIMPEIKLVLVGDTWDGYDIPAEIHPTISPVEAARIGCQSKIVICKHRNEHDLNGFPMMKPANVNRGYIECAYKAIVMVDNDRPSSSFTGEVDFYNPSNGRELEKSISNYLANYEATEPRRNQAYETAVREYTYLARMTKLLNAFRSPRWNVRIK